MSPVDQSAQISLSTRILILNNINQIVEFRKRKYDSFED
jgi:hypothetical protein